MRRSREHPFRGEVAAHPVQAQRQRQKDRAEDACGIAAADEEIRQRFSRVVGTAPRRQIDHDAGLFGAKVAEFAAPGEENDQAHGEQRQQRGGQPRQHALREAGNVALPKAGDLYRVCPLLAQRTPPDSQPRHGGKAEEAHHRVRKAAQQEEQEVAQGRLQFQQYFEQVDDAIGAQRAHGNAVLRKHLRQKRVQHDGDDEADHGAGEEHRRRAADAPQRPLLPQRRYARARGFLPLGWGGAQAQPDARAQRQRQEDAHPVCGGAHFVNVHDAEEARHEDGGQEGKEQQHVARPRGARTTAARGGMQGDDGVERADHRQEDAAKHREHEEQHGDRPVANAAHHHGKVPNHLQPGKAAGEVCRIEVRHQYRQRQRQQRRDEAHVGKRRLLPDLHGGGDAEIAAHAGDERQQGDGRHGEEAAADLPAPIGRGELGEEAGGRQQHEGHICAAALPPQRAREPQQDGNAARQRQQVDQHGAELPQPGGEIEADRAEFLQHVLYPVPPMAGAKVAGRLADGRVPQEGNVERRCGDARAVEQAALLQQRAQRRDGQQHKRRQREQREKDDAHPHRVSIRSLQSDGDLLCHGQRQPQRRGQGQARRTPADALDKGGRGQSGAERREQVEQPIQQHGQCRHEARPAKRQLAEAVVPVV